MLRFISLTGTSWLWLVGLLSLEALTRSGHDISLLRRHAVYWFLSAYWERTRNGRNKLFASRRLSFALNLVLGKRWVRHLMKHE